MCSAVQCRVHWPRCVATPEEGVVGGVQCSVQSAVQCAECRGKGEERGEEVKVEDRRKGWEGAGENPAN